MALKIKRDPLDILFSLYIRTRDKGVCQRCLTYRGIQGVECSHCHGRGLKSVRFDEDNACAFCMECHTHLDSFPLEKLEFWKQRLGERNFDLLNSRMRNTHPKPDKKLLTIYYTEKINQLGGM